MMVHTIRRWFRLSLTLAVLGFAAADAWAADQWTAPTAEELAMTSQPQVPGASAVYLYREESTEDSHHDYTEYVRLKILTEGGKDRANVELKYIAFDDFGFSITDVAGRTIHPDGTVIPFTGKPYERVILKAEGYKRKAKVFTLPDVTVGSIIEYRYRLRWNDDLYMFPEWIVQNDLFLRKGHFSWRPTDMSFDASNIAWLPILPAGMQVKNTRWARSFFDDSGSSTIELDVSDIPPSSTEEYMPPISSLGYRVMFYYTSYKNQDDFWVGEGKRWSSLKDKFIGPGQTVKTAVQQLLAPTDSQEAKLKKIYAAVEKLDNTDFTREHSRAEDKAAGLSNVRTTDDIWKHQRGSSDQITELFVAMARAAGMKAYVMAVTNRDRSLFLKGYLSLYQLNDDIAIVNLDGKEQSFDPGSRYCPYGHKAWKHSDAGGLRQTENGTSLVMSSSESYLASGVNRVANLKMDETGAVTGKVDLKFTGSPALEWRQKDLTDGKEVVDRDLKEHVQQMLPSGMDVKLLSIGELEEYEEPLTVSVEVKGSIGSPTGKRILIPGDLFEGNSKATFAHEKRELAVYFPYPYNARDAIRINLPEGFEVESVPAEGSVKLPKMAAYSLKAEANGSGVTIRRDLYVAQTVYLPKDYPELRTFYSQFEAKDQEPIVLKIDALGRAASAGAGTPLAAGTSPLQ